MGIFDLRQKVLYVAVATPANLSPKARLIIQQRTVRRVMIAVKKIKVMVQVDADNKAWLERQAVRYGSTQNSEIMRSVVERREREAAQERALAQAGTA
jgi:hypothetical protein